MKQILISCLILGTVFLTACKSNSSIGVIGGADGPTSISVTSEAENSIKKPLRMIKADGKLYYDSGRISKTAARCGTLDGKLIKTVQEHEIPKNDNECNFEGASGYQNATGITKEVPIGDEWVIFKLFDDPEHDMSVFKYCFYLKGSMPNAEKEHEMAVLTEDIDYDITDYYGMLGSYVGQDYGKYKTTFQSYGDTDKWGISLSAKNITSKGLTLMCQQFGGNPSGSLQTGASFTIEKSNNGNWEKVQTIIPEYAWTMPAYDVKANDITEFKIDWEWLYGKLDEGFYKIKKEFTDFRAAGDFDSEVYECYFEIN